MTEAQLQEGRRAQLRDQHAQKRHDLHKLIFDRLGGGRDKRQGGDGARGVGEAGGR